MCWFENTRYCHLNLEVERMDLLVVARLSLGPNVCHIRDALIFDWHAI